jgi:hypothetical protein
VLGIICTGDEIRAPSFDFGAMLEDLASMGHRASIFNWLREFGFDRNPGGGFQIPPSSANIP